MPMNAVHHYVLKIKCPNSGSDNIGEKETHKAVLQSRGIKELITLHLWTCGQPRNTGYICTQVV